MTIGENLPTSKEILIGLCHVQRAWLILVFYVIFMNHPLAGQSRISPRPLFNEFEVEKITEVYSVAQPMNPVQVWEEEFGIHIIEHLLDMVQDIANSIIPSNTEKKKNDLEVDIYLPPRKRNTHYPLLILAHGGAFVKGSKEEEGIVKLCQRAARHGIICASVDYRLMTMASPSFIKAGYVAAIDLNNAIEYFHRNASRLQIDRNRIFLGGISAGAVAALTTAFVDEGEDILGRNIKLDNLYGRIYGNNELRYKPVGVINISGGIFNMDVMTNNRMPLLSFHGINADEIVDPECALPFIRFSKPVNNMIDGIANLLIPFPKARQRILEAKWFEVCGSVAIHTYLKSLGLPSALHTYDDDHYLISSRDGNLTYHGTDVINKMIRFMNATRK